MSRKKKVNVAETGPSKPFFARYLEGQDTEVARSAKVGERPRLGYKKAAKALPSLQTLKFPSDSDELHYCPYYLSKADVPKTAGGARLQTLKYPSDRDEDIYFAEYLSKADVPKGKATAKGGSVVLKKKK